MAKKDAPGNEQAPDGEGLLMNGEEEIIDLLEVVKPGKAGLSDGEPEDVDFSRDLESMLDSLSAAEKAKASAFPDPTPVEHEVDHNESLDLPDMDDLDNLLESLGADAAKKETPEADAAAENGGEAESAGEALGLDAAPLAGARQAPEEPDEFAALLGALGQKKAQDEEAYLAGESVEALADALTPNPSLAQAPAAHEEEDPFALPDAAPDAAPDEAAFDKEADGEDVAGEEADEDPFAAALAAAARRDALAADAEPSVGVLPEEESAASGPGLIPEGDLPEESLSEEDGPKEDGPKENGTADPLLFDAENLNTAKGDIASEGLDVEAFVESPADAVKAEERDLFPAGALRDDEAFDSGMARDLPAQAPESDPDFMPETGPDRAFEADPDAMPDAVDAASAHSGSGLDEVDLVELDALLDDMLAGAPASGPGFTEAQPQEAPAPEASPVAAPADGEGVRDEASGLRQEVESLRRDLHEALSALSAKSSSNGDAAGFGGRLEDLELSMAAKALEDEERARTLQLHADRLGLLDGRLEVLEDACGRVDALEARTSALEARLEEMSANLDKVAAEAAARVIREELAALMAEQA